MIVSLGLFCYPVFWGVLIRCSWYLIMPSCSEFFSHVVLICAYALILSWDYYHNVWVLCFLGCGSMFTEMVYICPVWVSPGFHLSRVNFHSNMSVWDASTMWIVFIWTPYLYVAQTRACGPTRPDASLLLTRPSCEVLPFTLHNVGRVYVEV